MRRREDWNFEVRKEKPKYRSFNVSSEPVLQTKTIFELQLICFLKETYTPSHSAHVEQEIEFQ